MNLKIEGNPTDYIVYLVRGSGGITHWCGIPSELNKLLNTMEWQNGDEVFKDGDKYIWIPSDYSCFKKIWQME